jgi:AraC family transcriptional activator of pobA
MDAAVSSLYNSNMDTRPKHTIPTYNLYGESAELPDVLHCESISSRAVLHDWNIKPHRHQRLHQFFLVSSGGGTAEIDGRPLTLKPPLLINIPPLAVHAYVFEAGTEGWVITVPVEMLEAGTANSSWLANLIASAGSAPADPAVIALMNEIAAEHGRAEIGRAQALLSFIGLLSVHTARLIHGDQNGREGAGKGGFLRRFEALLEEHFREHWTVGEYASALAISPTHLSRLARAETGLPASRLIETRLVREARRALAYTNMTVSQIAYELGFDDPAYFTRVFTRAAGRSPSDYRRNLDRPYHEGAAEISLPRVC